MIEGLIGDRSRLVRESAGVLYRLLALWAAPRWPPRSQTG
jgi:hypothetical protein